MSEPRPPVLPGYTVVAFLRSSGMGTLWEMRDPQGRRVALKLADRAVRLDPERVRRYYRREAAAALHLDHAHIVRAYEVGDTEDGIPYLSLEYLEGQSLGERLRDGPLDEAEAVRVGLRVARALEHMHARGLVHRDVKPDNVMLLADGGVKLIDLGLAEEAGLAAPGCGSPGYASPEMARRGTVGPASDLFSLGATLAAAVLGRPAFQGETVQDVLRATVHQPLVLPQRVGEHELSAGFRSVVERLVRKSPRERYGSASELRLDLEALHEGDRPFAALLAERRPARRRHVAIGATLVVLLGVVLLVVMRPSSDTAAPDDTSAGAPPQVAETPAAEGPDEPPPNLQAEAALLFAKQRPDDEAESLVMLRAALGQAMPPGQRTRVEAACREVVAHREQRGRDELERRRAAAGARRDAGDLSGMAAALGGWPDDLAKTEAAAQAARDAEAWTRDALAPGASLLREATSLLQRASPDTASPQAVAALEARVRATLARASLPAGQRPELAEVAQQLEALGRRVRGRAREQGALEALRVVLEGPPGRRDRVLRALAEDPATEDTHVRACVLEVLDEGERTERHLAHLLRGMQDRAWARIERGELWVGLSLGQAQVDEVFVPGRTVWDEQRPWSRDPADALAHGPDPGAVAAWLWLRGWGGAHPGIGVPTAAPPLARMLGLVAADVLEPPGPGAPSAFWKVLAVRLRLTLRATEAAPQVPEVEGDPALAAWPAAIGRPRARRGRRQANPELDAARTAFLADDMLAAWQHLQGAIATDPLDGEAALLHSLVLTTLARPLPQRGVLLLALSEARRAWDLDPGLPRAPRQVADLCFALRGGAPEGLRQPLEALAERACDALLRGKEESAQTRTFLAQRLDARGEHDRALGLMRDARTRWPAEADLLLTLARLASAHGDEAEAVRALKEVEALSGVVLPPWAREILKRAGH